MTFPDSFSDKDKIEFLQRKVIINSICYYIFDKPIMTDNAYDKVSKELVDMTKSYQGESQYGYVMGDYDGSSGFDIYDRLNEKDKEYLTTIASRLALNGVDAFKDRR